jgi:pSer/pThr/pTyr-binding forkhead associated (FHA) protein
MRERSWTVGSLPECDVRIENPTVSGRHCRLTQRGDGFVLEDLQSTNGTFVADERIAGPRIVRRGDVVTLGRDTPLPWANVMLSITVGRAADNDVVIPYDAVSGHHARLERDGQQVFLIDLGSTNGTAINDPLKRITRAVLEPTDFVFLGTHRVAAADLLAAMPTDPPVGATVLERSSPEVLRKSVHTGASAPPTSSPMRSPAAWMAGAALSVVCLAVVLGGRALVNSRTVGEDGEARSTIAEPAEESTATLPADDRHTAQRTAPDPKRSMPEERLVREAADGVALVGLRIGNELLLKSVKVTCWTSGPSQVVCPTAILERLEGLRNKAKGHDASLVVCASGKVVAILSHKSVASGFSLAALEAPLDAVCSLIDGSTAAAPIPGQKLAMLAGRADSDNPTTIERTLSYLNVERIERGPDKSPLLLHCSGDAADPGAATGSPVFDASGRVVGCVEASIDKMVRVVPVSQLKLPEAK